MGKAGTSRRESKRDGVEEIEEAAVVRSPSSVDRHGFDQRGAGCACPPPSGCFSCRPLSNDRLERSEARAARRPGLSSRCCQTAAREPAQPNRSAVVARVPRVAALFYSLIESAKLTGFVAVLNDLEAKEEAAAERVA